jgi:NAD(P)-dependent dehydrogenase (short-subunit alcohol dehydrogenase family)
MQELVRRVAIITGAGSGIGRAAVRLFRQAGASVLAIDRSDEGLRETRDGLDRVETLVADAGDEN